MDENLETVEPTVRDARKPRKTREESARVMQWAPPALLPDPIPEQGFTFRWIRLSTLNASDPTNISGKLREGWEPVLAKDHPELQTEGIEKGRFAGGVEIGGLLLCKIPSELIAQRDAYYRQQAEMQMQSVDNSFMRQNDPRMPLFNERRTKVTFGKGT